MAQFPECRNNFKHFDDRAHFKHLGQRVILFVTRIKTYVRNTVREGRLKFIYTLYLRQ